MKNIQNQSQRYIKIGGEQIAVTEEVYQAYKRPLWAEEKRRERGKRCRDETGKRCMRECCLCIKSRIGSVLSLNVLLENGFYIPDSLDIAGYMEDSQLIRALHAEINELEPDNRKIVLLFASGLSEREIAAKVGLSQRGVNKRKTKIFAGLKEKLIDFI